MSDFVIWTLAVYGLISLAEDFQVLDFIERLVSREKR
jgi:hypothetical protein